MNIKSCRKCKEAFVSNSNSNICPSCIKKIDENFQKVRDYIYDNPNAKMEQICEATEVDRADIIMWLKQGKLIMDSAATPLINCETCGKPIVSGRYCAECNDRVRSSLTSSASSIAAKKQEQQARNERGRRGTHLDI